MSTIDQAERERAIARTLSNLDRLILALTVWVERKNNYG